MKKIGFKFNWMSLFFLTPIVVMWFLFFISKKTAIYPLNHPLPIPLNVVMTYSLPFLVGIVLTSIKIRRLYWWEWVEVTLTFRKFKKIKKRMY